MLKAIEREAAYRSDFLSEEEVFSTLYFGGGTPSLVAIPTLAKLLSVLRGHLAIKLEEFTFEVNPNDISSDYLLGLREIGVDRLSVGIQTFSPSLLSLLHRNHTPRQALGTLDLLEPLGYHRVSVDLIYGIPSQTEADLQRDLDTLLAYQVIDHLSAYALTIEPKTAWQVGIVKQKYPPVDQDQQYRHFEFIRGWARRHGWQHYEVSNFARPGCRSQHNQAYWNRTPYLGLGPSAHSFDGKRTRYYHHANNARYLRRPEPIWCIERLSQTDQVNEMIMLGLRTAQGFDKQVVFSLCQQRQRDCLEANINRHLAKGNFYIQGQWCRLTQAALFHCDGIAADLFLDEPTA